MAAKIVRRVVSTQSFPRRSARAWLVPLLIVGWAVASGVGRSVVLRRTRPRAVQAGNSVVLQLVRMLARWR